MRCLTKGLLHPCHIFMALFCPENMDSLVITRLGNGLFCGLIFALIINAAL